MRVLNTLLIASVSLLFASIVQAQNISVSVTPAGTTLLVTAQQEFTATVTNDAANRGVVWTVAANGTVCSGASCGTLLATSTASGAPITYEAPATPPAGGKVTVTAASVTDPTKSASATVTVISATNDARLKGDYAFTLNGVSTGSYVLAGVGRFTADGTGNIANGEMDINSSQYPGPDVIDESFTGTYAVGADNRGVMTWNIPGATSSSGTQPFANLTLALMADGSAVFSAFDPVGGRTELASGTLEKADTTAYTTAKITGDYAFGVAGVDHSNDRVAFAGRLTADGVGNFTNVAGDINASGAVNSTTLAMSSYTVSNTSTGRGTMRLTALVGLVPTNFNFVFYVVDSGKLFTMGRDAYAVPTPLLNGAFLRQQIPAGGFSNSALNSGMVIYLTGHSVCGSGTGPAPNVLAGLLSPSGNGALTFTYDQNCGGASASSTNQFGTFSVAGNGRSSMTVGATGFIAYLVSSNQAFFLGADSSVFFGFGEPQPAGPFTNGAVRGTYAGFTNDLATLSAGTFSGEFTTDGTSPRGNFTGTEDISNLSGPNSGVPFDATYAVSASPINGRGTITMTSGSGGSATMYVVSPSKFVVVPLSIPNPAIEIFKQ